MTFISFFLVYFTGVFLRWMFNYYSKSACWVWDDRSANEARSADLAFIISYPTSASEVIILLETIKPHNKAFSKTLYKMRKFIMFITAVCVLFLTKHFMITTITIVIVVKRIEKTSSSDLVSVQSIPLVYCHNMSIYLCIVFASAYFTQF